MFSIRVLVVLLVLLTNTWLLTPARSGALSRHKRALARRADSELSRLAGEPCAVSGMWRFRRHPRSVSPPQQRPPAAQWSSSTRGQPTADSASAVCAGGCGSDSRAAQRGAPAGEDRGTRGVAEEVAPGIWDAIDASARRFDQQLSPQERKDRRLGGEPRSRLHRSTGRESNISWWKVPPDTPADAQQLRGFPTPQPRSSAGSLEDEDHSGELEDADAPVKLPAGGSSPWGGPVPGAPPSWITALYFSGRREHLRLKPEAGVELPRSKFSMELWVKPEGGQSNPAIIAGECACVCGARLSIRNSIELNKKCLN